jgi:hypothetical protein
MGPGQK